MLNHIDVIRTGVVMAKRSQRRPSGGGRYTAPKPKRGGLNVLDGVLVEGQPYGMVAYLCTDPDCPDNQKR